MSKKTKLLVLATLALSLAGCAQIVTKNYKPVRGGVVKYSTGFFLADKNRAKAMEEMRAFCAPAKFTLLGEDSKVEFTGSTNSRSKTSGDETTTTSSQQQEGNVYIRFQCRK